MKLKEYMKLNWPTNLWSTVLQKRVTEQELPEDWEKALDYVLNERIDTKKAEIVLYYFRDGMTLQEIGNKYGLSLEAIRQHTGKAIRAMRYPSWRVYLIYGLEKGKMVIAEEQAAAKETRLDGGTIDVLNLSVRSYNCLRRAGIDTVEQLAQCNDEDLARLRNLGAKSLREIKDRIASIRGEDSEDITQDEGEQKATSGLISRASIIKAIEDISWYSVGEGGVLYEYARNKETAFVRYADVEAVLRKATPLPFVTNVYGRWLPRVKGRRKSRLYYCTNCKTDVEAAKALSYKYCPACGAKMGV